VADDAAGVEFPGPQRGDLGHRLGILGRLVDRRLH
jgi:hypothetical protein